MPSCSVIKLGYRLKEKYFTLAYVPLRMQINMQYLQPSPLSQPTHPAPPHVFHSLSFLLTLCSFVGVNRQSR